ncbi:MAG: tRNA lysidine(34) synthetase TilS [Betaproteobacteria bacterium HGW-Betaproteobacteria-8]|nr:MAG: tRNA lysidine(34) synthetase TilS [Betaproteobacteria bacterium HGW-Betaproteobacteria-8]
MSKQRDSTVRQKARAQAVDSAVNQLSAKLADYIGSTVEPGQHLLLAFSGGLDSCVLLHLLAEHRSALGFELQAMHVHHGLSPNADDWATFCKQTCTHLNIPLQIVHVEVAQDGGTGIEAAARQARYQALFGAKADYIVLAHHQDDQAETLLLQLFRGSGVKGLAAMAMMDKKRRLLRPLLDTSREELLQYATARRLSWIEDESNLDRRYDRNYLRHDLMPLIEARFKSAKKVLARTAGHMAESAGLLDDLAQIDAACSGLSLREIRQRLPLDCLQRLSLPRGRNLLRWWLSLNQLDMPNAARLEEMLNQLLSARADAVISVKISSDAHLRRFRNEVYVEYRCDSSPFSLLWSGQPQLVLPDGSRLTFEKRTGQGLASERLGIDKLRIASREGGERFKPDAQRPTRTLKHLLQEAEIPPWERQKLPLIYLDDELALVPGIGVTANMQAQAGETGLVIEWHTD